MPHPLLPCCAYWVAVLLAPVSTSAAKSAVQIGKRWWSLGPFASGKVEYDGDPLEPLGGALALFERGPGTTSGDKESAVPRKEWGSFLAEHVTGGKLTWQAAQVEVGEDGYTGVAVPYSHVPFQALISQPPLGSGSDVRHVQNWVFGSLKINTPGRFAVDCRGLHTFRIARARSNESSFGPFAGNIYRRSANLGAVLLEIKEPGLYRIYSRVRGKVPLQFACNAKIIDKPFRAELHSKNFPDIVLGGLISAESVLDVRMKNMEGDWLEMYAEVVEGSGRQSISISGRSGTIWLPPGAMTQVPLPITAEGDAVEKEQAGCVRFEVAVSGRSGAGEISTLKLPAQLRCRKSTQSALFTFLDPDNSVGVAAVLFPRRRSAKAATAPAIPIVISMSGVGVGPQQQADAYKMKNKPQDPGDFIFGFEELWVMVPQRGGPHNWEDAGMRTALQAIDVLAAAPAAAVAGVPRADGNRLVVHGHSRGGHGAWGIATRIPDRVLGVASACGWYSREEYGDANNLWVHEVSLMHMDKVLLGLLSASIAENENSLHAANLKASRALVRVASRDTAVPPWFGRRMARHMQEEGVDVLFEEFDQEHWWWDSKQTNDGGVMHDEAMRDWTLNAVKGGLVSLSSALTRGELTIVASGPEYAGRFGIQVLQRAASGQRAFIRVSGSEKGLQLRTANVLRFLLRGEAAALCGGKVKLDGVEVTFDAVAGAVFCRGVGEHSCKVGSGGGACTSGMQATGYRNVWELCTSAPLRPTALLGPMRNAFAAPWTVVLPDEPTALETRLASYVLSGHLTAYETAAQAMPLSRASSLRSSHRFMWLGTFRKGSPHWPLRVEEESTVLSIGPCTLGLGHGAAFLAPATPESQHLLDLVVTATDEKALEDLVTFSFATNQEHTRSPFANMLPDFFVTGPDFSWRGYGGVVAAGFWGSQWEPDGSSYFQC